MKAKIVVAALNAKFAEVASSPVPRIVAAADAGPAEGEIRKVDAEARKITIRHGELKNLDMPPMTMVFRVRDPAMIDMVKPGDKVRFRADKIDGSFTVTEIEVVK